MNLLYEIQASTMQEENIDIGPILLKLRFLASRLGSDLLEEWVTHEADGYPEGILVPDYRKINVAYEGTFSDMVKVLNVPIPPSLVKKYAGGQWVKREMRQGIAEVDEFIRSSKSKQDMTLHIDASDLILHLQDKIYEGMACNRIIGLVSVARLAATQFSVRKRVLELTIQLEKAIPAAGKITIGNQSVALPLDVAKATTHIAHQTIYTNNYTVISNSGAGIQSVSVSNISKGDVVAFEKALIEGGIAGADAAELAQIVSKEDPQSKEEPFGVRAKAWVAKNIDKATKGSWQIGKEVAMKLLTEVATRYYFKMD